jgi:hypothetical protein
MEPVPEIGRRLALLVATSAYNDPDLRQLRAPGHDATELAEVLHDPRIGGFDVQVLINPASGEVQEGIEDFCIDRHPAAHTAPQVKPADGDPRGYPGGSSRDD